MVKIAARMFKMPVAVVNMVGSDHVFFAASYGFEGVQVDMSRDVSFCAHAIARSEVMVVPDATVDERFCDNPLVTGATNLRFYAGVPLMSPDGHALGTLCVIDGQPHCDFSEEDCDRLRELAKMAADRLELRRIEFRAQEERGIPPEPLTHSRRTAVVLFDERGEIQDLSAPQREEQALKRLTDVDMLTGLANRACFYRRVEDALTLASPIAVVIVDIYQFKDVNATLGSAVGDGILCDLARRLERAVGPNATVARIGGDEFAILQRECGDSGQVKDVADAVIAQIADPIAIDGHDVRLSVSCGVAIAPLHAQEALELIGNAELAQFKAASIGPGRSFVFSTALRNEAVARRISNIELHRAVSDGEFVLFYQPQVCLADGSITGTEALIRWLHPQHGLLSPAAFLPALEEGTLALIAGSWILDEACAQAAQWRRGGAKDFRIGVNLFSAQVRANDFCSQVLSALERHGLPPQVLELEVTENIVLDGDELVLKSLQDLRNLGVGIAFDDFGTGYASLSLLKRFPLSRIKIDRSFVQGMLESERDASIVRALIDMARSFGLETIAEGVETEEQRERLCSLGCQEAQGYLFSRPVPAVQIAEAFKITAHMG
ncbi:sensor domain-containing phosphodiesterase [Cupriavidus pampae]|uniref:sensor domain-containing phosphodiesterase n=1 Tax=Cupriavidus pampae TaxID=659251 RepID=UPI002096D77E|nr:EAL domain-containing protein [Cupriavidus pampae]